MHRSIGIDFGTSVSSVFTVVKGTPKVIFSRAERRSTPSVVAVNNDRISVGEFQKAGAAPDLKRIIGLSYHDSMVKRYIEDSQVKLEKTSDGAITVPVDGKQLRVEEVITLLFRDLTYDLKKIEITVITVPASFGSIRRQAIRDAADIAGFRKVELISETTAAAVTFAKKIKDNAHLRETRLQNPKETTLIFQLGRGTIDVAIFEITKNCVNLLGSASSCDLGVIEFDRNLLNHLAENGKLIVEDTNRAELMQLCKEATEFLTSAETFNRNEKIDIPITKNEFETAGQDLLTTISAMIDLAVQAAKLRLEKVDEYILIGRGSQIPCVKDMIERKLGEEKRNNILDICEAAVKGAAVCAKTIRYSTTRHLRFWKRFAKIDWKTKTRTITIKENHIIDTDGLNEKQAEELIGDLLKKLPETPSIEIKVQTELSGLREREKHKLKKKLDELIDKDKELQRLEKKQSDLEKDLLELQEKSVNCGDIQNWCIEKLDWLRHNDRIPETKLDECEKELDKKQNELEGKAMLESSTTRIETETQTSEFSIDRLDGSATSISSTVQHPSTSRTSSNWLPKWKRPRLENLRKKFAQVPVQ